MFHANRCDLLNDVIVPARLHVASPEAAEAAVIRDTHSYPEVPMEPWQKLSSRGSVHVHSLNSLAKHMQSPETESLRSSCICVRLYMVVSENRGTLFRGP